MTLRPAVGLLVLAVLALIPIARGEAVVVDPLGDRPLVLSRDLEILADPTGALSLGDVTAPANAGRFASLAPGRDGWDLGYSPVTYWFRLRLTNPGLAADALLEVASPSLTSLDFFVPDDSGGYASVHTGSVEPFSSRPHPNRYFVFPVTLKSQSEGVYYLRVRSTNALVLPVNLWNLQAFETYTRANYLVQALYLGMALAMVLFNLLLFLALRDVSFLLYVAFITCAAATVSMTTGLAKEYLWPGAGGWSDSATYIGFSLSLATLLLFVRHMLETPRTMTRVDPWLRGIAVFYLLLPGAFLVALPSVGPLSAGLNAGMGVVILAVGIQGALRRQREAYFFLASFTVLIVGGLVTFLRDWGVLPNNLVTAYGLQFGVSIHTVLLAIALADRFNALRRQLKRDLEQKVLERTQELKEALSTKDRFFSLLAHDLRGPMGGLNRLALLVQEQSQKEPGADLTEYLGLFTASTAKLYALLENVLTWSGTQTGQIPFHPQWEDLRLLVDENVSLVENQAFTKGLSVIVEPGGPVEVFGDRDMLSTVLRNLLSNALKFTPRRGRVTVSVAARADGVEVVIADTGVGLSADRVAHLFRVDGARSTLGTNREPGTGLGLVLCREFIEMHGGSLGVESRPDEGSRFWFTVPRSGKTIKGEER